MVVNGDHLHSEVKREAKIRQAAQVQDQSGSYCEGINQPILRKNQSQAWGGEK